MGDKLTVKVKVGVGVINLMGGGQSKSEGITLILKWGDKFDFIVEGRNLKWGDKFTFNMWDKVHP